MISDAWECPCCGGMNDMTLEICPCGEGARDERKDKPLIYLEQDGDEVFRIGVCVGCVVGFFGLIAWLLSR